MLAVGDSWVIGCWTSPLNTCPSSLPAHAVLQFSHPVPILLLPCSSCHAAEIPLDFPNKHVHDVGQGDFSIKPNVRNSMLWQGGVGLQLGCRPTTLPLVGLLVAQCWVRRFDSALMTAACPPLSLLAGRAQPAAPRKRGELLHPVEGHGGSALQAVGLAGVHCALGLGCLSAFLLCAWGSALQAVGVAGALVVGCVVLCWPCTALRCGAVPPHAVLLLAQQLGPLLPACRPSHELAQVACSCLLILTQPSSSAPPNRCSERWKSGPVWMRQIGVMPAPPAGQRLPNAVQPVRHRRRAAMAAAAMAAAARAAARTATLALAAMGQLPTPPPQPLQPLLCRAAR